MPGYWVTQGLPPPIHGALPPPVRMWPSSMAILALIERTPGSGWSAGGVAAGLSMLVAVSGVEQAVSGVAAPPVPCSAILRGGNPLPLPGLGSRGILGGGGLAPAPVVLPGLGAGGGGMGLTR